MHLRSELEMMSLFKKIVMDDPRIRLSVLEGSRTNRNIPKDNFQDYDISFFVTDMDSLKENETWLESFGTVIFMQKPEDMELYEPELGTWYSYLMYLSDGNKVDLTLIPLDEIDSYFKQSDGLVEVLIDKDNRVKGKTEATDEKYWVKMPTEQEFIDCCNEFWHVTAYVAKGLYRKEILFALDHFNEIVRPELLRMISWEVGCREGFTFSLGKNYKFLDKYLEEEDFNRILDTFSLQGYEETWRSLKLCCQLFISYSKKVAQKLEYSYPNYDEVMTDYITQVYSNLSKQGD
ncbi:aminoglycoside 6-adenylyltransferase [Ornithinibacillus halotolerans]|uniref:Aminoglycoside 6-adenylyltransferase n=1 Tax=Ornithinibacillus halotolerans TaxID=1274357 RepID=A0A916RVG9_9BACI|nr:aminoglycoside 6-adenylyltransferase [Ornithinibacillus halotolerans]GGA72573.1 aminoglycoside 6-adenylyltransferase [Ornithinibacillus halotolerans]